MSGSTVVIWCVICYIFVVLIVRFIMFGVLWVCVMSGMGISAKFDLHYCAIEPTMFVIILCVIDDLCDLHT